LRIEEESEEIIHKQMKEDERTHRNPQVKLEKITPKKLSNKQKT